MSNLWKSFLKILDESVDSISIVNNDGNPQIVIKPKGTAKNILDAVNKGKENGQETTQEGK